MNLYAINGNYAPGNEVVFVLAETHDEAMRHGVFVAAHDIANANYFSPSAAVYLVAADITKVGDAFATDAPADWEWAHPAVEENVVDEVCGEIEARMSRGDAGGDT